jgi:hypothetical protein
MRCDISIGQPFIEARGITTDISVRGARHFQVAALMQDSDALMR